MAASIIAKVERDEWMDGIDMKFPEYGFKRHKGYGTKDHLRAIKIYGPCEEHRKSFKPVKNFKFSALEAFDKYEISIIAKELLQNKTDQEIKKELTKLTEKAEFLKEEKKQAEIERIKMLQDTLRTEWIFIKNASRRRSF